MTTPHPPRNPEASDPTLAIAPSPDGGATRPIPLREGPGTTIGPYKILQLIGEGGFGTVFMAEQEQPVRRRVALKIIKLGMDTRMVVGRFEQERQALALMDHPHIARVLDAGATEAGRPYFVMELVKGEPIVEYCDKNMLSIEGRLELFAEVCQAVQHAHTKGIIHRDIKPSNVLVTLVDGRPSTKVIDFGIAKATNARLTEMTLFTEHRQLIGTPEYMSPEQAEGSLDIDTRTDVYSLGVLLYELLTGTTPFHSSDLRSAAYGEIQRIIREVDPPKPSTRLGQNTRPLADVASHRRTDSRRLTATVRGELDWIVMKALEKDRQRRYETANGLGMDIRRYLSGEAVLAAPPGAVYRLGKLARRHQAAVLAFAAVGASLLVGAVGFAWQAQRAGAERNRAVAAEAEAIQRAGELQKVADFQGQLLAQVDPTAAGLRLTTDVRSRLEAALTKAAVPEDQKTAEVEAFLSHWGRINVTDASIELIDGTILKPAVAAIDKQFADQPVVAARLRNVLAERYHDLGLDKVALPMSQAVLAERRRLLGDDHADTIQSMNNAASFLLSLGQSGEAVTLYREALDRSRRLRGVDDRQTLGYMNDLGVAIRENGKIAEAAPYIREAYDRRRRVLPADDPEMLNSITEIGSLLRDEGKLAEAEPYYRDVLEKRRRLLGEDDPATLRSCTELAVLLKARGELAESISLFRQVVEKRRRLMGDVHPATMLAISNLGATLSEAEQSAEAEALMRESLSNRRRLLGPDDPDAINSLSNLALFLIDQGKTTEAEPMCREALERRRRVLGEDHPETLIANNVMGYVLRKQEKVAEAEPFVRQTVAISQRTLGPSHPDTLLYKHNLGILLMVQKKFEESGRLLREVAQTGEPKMGGNHPVMISAVRNLAGVLIDEGKIAEGADVLTAAEPNVRKAFAGKNDRQLGIFLSQLGNARTKLGQFATAEPVVLESYQFAISAKDSTPNDVRNRTELLSRFYQMWHEAEPDKGHEAKAGEWKAKLDALPAPPAKPDGP